MKTATSSSFRRLLAALPAAALAVGLAAGCAGSDPASDPTGSASTSVDPTEHVAENLTEFSYDGQDGRTALELLQEKDPDAVVQGEGDQAFVTAVRGREADEDSEFWALYVDGEQAPVGAGSLETQDGQTITWKLEEFE